MSLIPAKTPKLIKGLYSSLFWSFNTTKKEIYLTFDDGPTPKITHWVLDTLEKYNAKATFFCIGNNIEKHPEIVRAIFERGHDVGNHTFNHSDGFKHSLKTYLKDVLDTENIIDRKNPKKLFRPPYGKIKRKQIKALTDLNYKIIMWDVLSFDWDKNSNTTKDLENIKKKTDKGSIIVFHDSEKAFDKLEKMLPETLEYFSNLGYSFKQIPL